MATNDNAANVNDSSIAKMPGHYEPEQQNRIIEHAIERSRSRSRRRRYWESPYETDPERTVVPRRPTTLAGSNSDSRLNQNRRIVERVVDPDSEIEERALYYNKGLDPRRPSNNRPSRPRRAASLPPRDKRQKSKERVKSKDNPDKERKQQADESNTLRIPLNIDAVYNSVEAKDVTVHMEIELFNDLDEELEIFNRLTRIGNFAFAKEFFDSHLTAHVDDPNVFVQYAEMLLEQGDFKSLLSLDGSSIFREQGRNEPKDAETGIRRLELNWKLIRAIALCYSQHKLSTVWERKNRPLEIAPNTWDLTTTRKVLTNFGERDLKDWADWKKLYKKLLAEDRIWDLRDVILTLSRFYGTEEALAELVGSASPKDQLLADWETDPPDESTSLALLDILSFMALNTEISLEIRPFAEECLRSAERIGNSLLDHFPHTIHSRPFIQWVLAKALVKSGAIQFDYLLDYPGQSFFPKLGAMPYYIPVRKENPGWLPPSLTPMARESLEMALRSSKQIQDYQTEAQFLKELALRSKAPAALFDDLAHLQTSKQLNKAGYLSTCLSRYLICKDESSKASLLKDLESFGWWQGPSNLVNPNAAAAKDVLQRALSQEDADGSAKSMEAALRYYEYLWGSFPQTIDRNIARSSRRGHELLPTVTRVNSPSPPSIERRRQRGSDGRTSRSKKTTGRAVSKEKKSEPKGGIDVATRNDQQWDHFPPPPRRNTDQTEEIRRVGFASDNEKYEKPSAKRQSNDTNKRTENAFDDSRYTEREHTRQRSPKPVRYVEVEETDRQQESNGPHPRVYEVVDDDDEWEDRRESSTDRRHRRYDDDGRSTYSYYSSRSTSSSPEERREKGRNMVVSAIESMTNRAEERLKEWEEKLDGKKAGSPSPDRRQRRERGRSRSRSRRSRKKDADLKTGVALAGISAVGSVLGKFMRNRDGGKAIEDDDRQRSRSRRRSRSVSRRSRRRNSAPERTREEEKDVQKSTTTREHGDQGQQQTQTETNQAPLRKQPPPLPPRTAIAWGKPVVEEIVEDETASKRKDQGNVDIDVSEVTEDAGADDEGAENKATDSKASDEDGDIESKRVYV
ncbi:hypothetical protein Daus18300_010052 [Diaporthe australafricana]|uniref:Uncharacterized protein n=1 Tax=Diaporthe australafricana TaxID=127596 RepID=A0ABR3WBZ6_9PEZI